MPYRRLSGTRPPYRLDTPAARGSMISDHTKTTADRSPIGQIQWGRLSTGHRGGHGEAACRAHPPETPREGSVPSHGSHPPRHHPSFITPTKVVTRPSIPPPFDIVSINSYLSVKKSLLLIYVSLFPATGSAAILLSSLGLIPLLRRRR